MWKDANYCWVVLCKNHWFHVRKNLFFRHKIPLAQPMLSLLSLLSVNTSRSSAMSAERRTGINPRTCGESSSNFRSDSSPIQSFKKNPLLRMRLSMIRTDASSRSHAKRSRRRRDDPKRNDPRGKPTKRGRLKRNHPKTNYHKRDKRELKGPESSGHNIRDRLLTLPNPPDRFRHAAQLQPGRLAGCVYPGGFSR